jgi:hypothetical protein
VFRLCAVLARDAGRTPAGWEHYMRDLAEALAGGTPTQREIGEIASRYDFQVV